MGWPMPLVAYVGRARPNSALLLACPRSTAMGLRVVSRSEPTTRSPPQVGLGHRRGPTVPLSLPRDASVVANGAANESGLASLTRGPRRDPVPATPPRQATHPALGGL